VSPVGIGFRSISFDSLQSLFDEVYDVKTSQVYLLRMFVRDWYPFKLASEESCAKRGNTNAQVIASRKTEKPMANFRSVLAPLLPLTMVLLLFRGSSYSQEYLVESEASEAVQKVMSFGRALVEDFEFELKKYASVVEARFHSSPTATRLFDSQARLERFEDGSIVWMKNTWKTDDIDDNRIGDRRQKIIPAYKNCMSELLILDSGIFEMEISDALGPGRKPMKPRLTKILPFLLNCGFGVEPKDWPFVYETCFIHPFECKDRLEIEFGKQMRCLAANPIERGFDTIWSGLEGRAGYVKGISRIIFEDELPVRYEIWFSDDGFPTGPGKLNFSKASRLAQVKTRWKKLDLISVPERVEAFFYVPGANNGFEELYVDGTLEFFLPDSKEFKTYQEAAHKLEERAKKLAASSRMMEE